MGLRGAPRGLRGLHERARPGRLTAPLSERLPVFFHQFLARVAERLMVVPLVLAFNEMTALAVYRPLARHAGRPAALAGAFVFSGLLHEMAISLPVKRGFGLPLSYFLLHGAAMLYERHAERRGRPIGGTSGRVWTLLWLVLPLPLLFHMPFLAGVLWPLIGID